MRKLTILAFLLCLGAGGWGAWDLYQPYRSYGAPEFVEIDPGTSVRAIAEVLVSRGVLAHRWPFLVRYWIARRHHTLKAGEYYFDHPLRPIDVYFKLTSGDVYYYTVVVPEGSDRFDIARILSDRLKIDPATFLQRTTQVQTIHDLDPTAPSLEGYLFPDTYRFPHRTTVDTVVMTMVARFRHMLQTRLHDDIQSNPLKLHGVVTLASLVEKETPDPDERPVVAGVFTRRLEKGMLLQCDPTVVYAARLAERPSAIIHVSDLKFDSPFNTYIHGGLPPGPIANPGLSSIRAALHPDDGDALYFVSNNHGGHVFARTLEEHQQNVARYRQEVSAQKNASPAPRTPDKSATP